MNAVIQHGSPLYVKPPRMKNGEAANYQLFSNDKKRSKDAQMTLSGNMIDPVAATVWRQLHNAIMEGEITRNLPDLSRYFRQKSILEALS